jgi:hypothetical protein
MRSADRFQKLEDGWIKDNLLGIEWGPSSNKVMNFKEAQKYCAEAGGRLPELEELALLADRSKHNPAINTEVFTDTKTDDWYWTGSEVAGVPGFAWVVPFDHGYVTSCGEDDSICVRPVRSSQ